MANCAGCACAAPACAVSDVGCGRVFNRHVLGPDANDDVGPHATSVTRVATGATAAPMTAVASARAHDVSPSFAACCEFHLPCPLPCPLFGLPFVDQLLPLPFQSRFLQSESCDREPLPDQPLLFCDHDAPLQPMMSGSWRRRTKLQFAQLAQHLESEYILDPLGYTLPTGKRLAIWAHLAEANCFPQRDTVEEFQNRRA